jgi:putative ABC transport system substrate-binding protein
MQRREFIRLAGSAAAAWPLVVRAQQADSNVRIGILGPTLQTVAAAANYKAFLDALGALGFNNGQNISVEYRQLDEPGAATALIRSHPTLIVALGSESALKAILSESHETPIVIAAINYDPVALGYVASLARSGGNITGVAFEPIELAKKQVELLTQAFPDRPKLGILWDDVSADQFNAAEGAAKLLNVELLSLKLSNPPYDFSAAFRILAERGAQKLLVLSSEYFATSRPLLAELEIKYRLPAMFIFKSYVEAGGLMSYGVPQAVMYRRAAGYVAKIIKGAKPAELPLERPSTFELVLNLKTAKALGIEMPQAILLRADEVIE